MVDRCQNIIQNMTAGEGGCASLLSDNRVHERSAYVIMTTLESYVTESIISLTAFLKVRSENCDT